ncbi:MAG: ISAs1 family transposase, partial [Candidatus Competibacteraceae bacterium]|nr:ISAs1 family transposase [Candidatus Competibacteraceae bacterium]
LCGRWTALASKPSAGWNPSGSSATKPARNVAYFLCSFSDRDRFAAAVRMHWGIENQQHWVLDVQFGEDACRTRRDHSAENLALIRRIALNLLRHNGPPRDSIRRRKLRAALNDDDRLRLLLGQSSPATT